MNNYCTNCGKRLEENEVECKNCHTPIVDIPKEENNQSTARKTIKVILLVILIGAIVFVAYKLMNNLMMSNKIKNIQEEYVEPFIINRYNTNDFSIEYDSTGMCIISGECAFDPVMGCDGGACEEYEYLEGCTSYYYIVELDGETHTITVFENNDIYSVVEGKNIYGTDVEQGEQE